MIHNPCPRCGSEEIEESEIAVEYKCGECEMIWGHDGVRGHYYFPKWRPGITGITTTKIIKIPEGCLWTGHTKKVERKEA